jgi:hypothetical protein
VAARKQIALHRLADVFMNAPVESHPYRDHDSRAGVKSGDCRRERAFPLHMPMKDDSFLCLPNHVVKEMRTHATLAL